MGVCSIMSSDYLEDRKYILAFIEDQKKINKDLFVNDEELKIALSKLVVKIGLITAGASIFIASSITIGTKLILG
jgi:hypothetical protein